MLDIKIIRENPGKVKTALKSRGRDLNVVDEILKLDEAKRKLQNESELIKAEQNKMSRLRQGSDGQSKKPSEAELGKLKEMKDELSGLTTNLSEADNKLNELLLEIPNVPFDDVPIGKDENDNKPIREWGKPPDFSAQGGFAPKDYMEIGEALDIIDIKRASKISGSRFGFLKGEAVMIEIKLLNLVMNLLTEEGFIPIFPPVMISEETMKRTGHLSKTDAKEKYFFPEDKMFLVGSSEQSILPMHGDEVFDEADLPRRYVGFSTCFRREAGSYGKDTKGILRVHQFDKIEMISYVKPEDSEKELEYLVSLQEKIMQKLGLHYQVVAICTGDMGVTAARQYDIEAWIPSQNKFRETHSASNCTDYQTRRLNIRYKNKSTGKNEYVHALNATGLAMGRAIIALIENYQTKEGGIDIKF